MRNRISRALQVALVGASLFALSGTAAMANQLEDIKAAGKIRIAIDLGNPPFAMMDANFQPTGSEVETARLLAEGLGVELEIVEVPTASRVQFLVSDKADIAVSTLSITAERLEVVDFSRPHGEIAAIVAAAPDADVSSYADLSGMTVAVTRGTTNDVELTNGIEGVDNVNVVRFEDDPTSSAAVTSGQVDAYATSRPLFTELKNANPDLNLEEKFVVQSWPLAIALQQDEPELKEWINQWLEEKLGDGTLVDIYEKYHGVRLDPGYLASLDPRNG